MSSTPPRQRSGSFAGVPFPPVATPSARYSHTHRESASSGHSGSAFGTPGAAAASPLLARVRTASPAFHQQQHSLNSPDSPSSAGTGTGTHTHTSAAAHFHHHATASGSGSGLLHSTFPISDRFGALASLGASSAGLPPPPVRRSPFAADAPRGKGGLVIEFDAPGITALSVSPDKDTAALASREGLFLFSLDRPREPPAWVRNPGDFGMMDTQWNPHMARKDWIAGTVGFDT